MDSVVFASFRRRPEYLEILEAVSESNGQSYLDEVKKMAPQLLESREEIFKNDDWGNPIRFKYSEFGEVAPSTLRYTKVLADLYHHFDDLDGKRIAEIGVGYGGQCRLISTFSSPAEYTLIDLQPALRLAQRYLDNYALNTTLRFMTMNELQSEAYDLVISNYAFTELPRNVQEVYMKKVVMESGNGYLTYNEITPEYFDSMNVEEISSRVRNASVLPEVPLTSARNCIIVWKADK